MMFWELCLAQNIVKYYGSDSAKGRVQKLRNFESRARTWIHASTKSSTEALNAILAVITSWLVLFLRFLCLRFDHSQYDELLIRLKGNVIEFRCAGKGRLNKLKLIGKLGICWLLLIRSLCREMVIGMIDGVKNIVRSNRTTAKVPEKLSFCHPDIDTGFEFEIDSDSDSGSKFITFYDIIKDVDDHYHYQVDEELDDDDDGFPHTYPIVETCDILT